MSSHQSNSKTDDLDLLLKTNLKVLKLFPVACRYADGTNGNMLKFETIGKFFQVFILLEKSSRNLLLLALSDKII